MRHNNIWNVIRFEITRNLKKPSFWVVALFLPILLTAYIAFFGFIGASTGSSVGQSPDVSEMTLGVYDEAEYLTSNTVVDSDGNQHNILAYDSKNQGIDDVKSGSLDVFYYIPADFSTLLTVETYAKPSTASIFSDYAVPIKSLLSTSAASKINAEDLAVLTNSVSIDSTNFASDDDSEIDVSQIISKMVIPLAGAILFFVLVVMFGNRLTTAMVEEKENRVSEIILTSINPRDLIIGKIVSLILLGLVQIIVLAIPMLLMYFLGTSQNIIPADFMISFDPYLIISTILLVILSYFLFSAMGVFIGTLVPTAKEAASFTSILMILVMLPLIFVSTFMSETPNLAVYVMSYFPPSAPIALMLRDAFGTLPLWELILGLVDLALFSFLFIKLAVFVFKRSAINFTSKVNLRSLIKTK